MAHEGIEFQAAPGESWTQGHGLRGKPVANAGLVIGIVTLLATVPACSSPATSTSTSTSTSISIQQGSSAEVAACETDAKTLVIALEAYMAEKGAFPPPPFPWSAATYAANFEPLTSAGGGGPYMQKQPSNEFYVIEYDSAGHVWIAPPGSYGATYNRGQSFDASPDICLAAVG